MDYKNVNVELKLHTIYYYYAHIYDIQTKNFKEWALKHHFRFDKNASWMVSLNHVPLGDLARL